MATRTPRDHKPKQPTQAQRQNGKRDIRPVKMIFTLVYGEYANGELVAEFPGEQEILYRRDFAKLADKAEQAVPLVRKQLDEAQQNGSGP